MARKGRLAPGIQLDAVTKNGAPRCQFVKFPKPILAPDGSTSTPMYGEQCKNTCISGRPRCKYHGGLAGRPVVSGKYSKYNPVPKGLRDKYDRATEDPEILNLTNKIALLDAQIWQIAEFAQDQDTFTTVQMKQLIVLLKQQKELVAQETSRRVTMGSMLSAEQVMTLIGFIYSSINKHVQDHEAKRKIGNDLRTLLHKAPEVGDVLSQPVLESDKEEELDGENSEEDLQEIEQAREETTYVHDEESDDDPYGFAFEDTDRGEQPEEVPF